MRILKLLRDQSTNGITTYHRMLTQALRAQGHDVMLWPGEQSRLRQDPRTWLLHHRLEPLVRSAVASWKPDVIYVSHYTQARLAHRLRETLCTPWVTCMHNGHSPKRMAQWAHLLTNTSGVVTMSRTMDQLYQDLVHTPDWPAAAPRPAFLLSRLPLVLPPMRAPHDPSQPLTLTYCSRLSGNKGPRCAAWLQAVASLPEAQHFRLQVIGGGSHLATLKKQAQDLGLAVEFTGMVADPGPWLDRTDVMTGAGYALIEGLVRGCAGVGLGFGGCFGAITPGRLDEAFAINFGDHCPYPLPEAPEAIAQALTQAIAMYRQGVMSAVVTQRCRAQFDPAGIAAELAVFLQTVAR